VKYGTEDVHEIGLVLSPKPKKEYEMTSAAVVKVVAVAIRVVIARRFR